MGTTDLSSSDLLVRTKRAATHELCSINLCNARNSRDKLEVETLMVRRVEGREG